MDYPDLISKLPAAAASALSIAAANCYVARERRRNTTTPEAWWRLEDDGPEIVNEVLGGTIQAHLFELRVAAAAGTAAGLEVFGRAIREFFHGQRQPTGVTDLVGVQVEDVAFDQHPSEGPDLELVATLKFLGVERP